MRAQGPTFWPLNGQLDPKVDWRGPWPAGWQTDRGDGVAVSRKDLRLAVNPDGPLSLTWPDDSLGGLTLPRGMALTSDGILYLWSKAERAVKRFNPATRRFERVPGLDVSGADAREFIGPSPCRARPVPRQPHVSGADTRQFIGPLSLAVVGRDLVVADAGARRVQVFDLGSLLLRHVWGPLDAEGRPIAVAEAATWRPMDVASGNGVVYILDAQFGRVYRALGGADSPELCVRLPLGGRDWSGLAVDRAGQVYIGGRPSSQDNQFKLSVYKSSGEPVETVAEPGAVRDHFDSPTLRLFYADARTPRAEGLFCLPVDLARLCDRRTAPACLERPLLPCQPPAPPTSVAAYEWRTPDLKSPEDLVARWQAGCDPLSRAIRRRLTPEDRAQLDAIPPGPPDDEVRQCLLRLLNLLLAQDDLAATSAPSPRRLPAVWPTDRPGKRPVPPRSLALRATDAAALDVAHRNRMLLEQAYPAALAVSPHTAPGPLVFTRDGQPAQLEPDAPLGPQAYRTCGEWTSRALDSGIYRCQWHRIELDIADLPPGASVTVYTYAAAAVNLGPPYAPPVWDLCGTITGPMEGPPASMGGDGNSDDNDAARDLLVQSREGQYLWLKVVMQGDGYRTPVITGMRVHYPRESYLRYLPAVFSADDESRWFLERFLAVFQTEWDALDARIDDIAALFDPAAAGEGFLEALASLVALPLERGWTADQKRNLLMAVPSYYRQRGTLQGLRTYLRAYLANLGAPTGAEPDNCPNEVAPDRISEACGKDSTATERDDYTNFPILLEGFRERHRLLLAQPGASELGRSAWLWGPSVVGRLQVDSFARPGEVRLVSTGDPARDLFHTFAHRFRVFVPAAWVRTQADEQTLRRALDAEKPAQTSYELCLLEPRFRVGIQSTVGVDTLIGGYPVTRLACPDPTAPGSRPPRSCLGYDTLLGGGPVEPLRLTPAPRIGIDTALR